MIISDASECWQRAGRFLARRDYSVFELGERLRTVGFDEASIEATLVRCQQEGFLSDASFAERWIEKKALKGWGPDLVRTLLLSEHRLDEPVVDEAMDRVDPLCWDRGFLRIFQRRFGELDGSDGVAEALDYFQKRGYGVEYIEKMMQ